MKKYKYQKVLQADPIVEMLLNPVPKYMCWTQKPASNDNALGNRNYCITSATIILVPGHGRCIVGAAQHSSWENRTINHDSLCHV